MSSPGKRFLRINACGGSPLMETQTCNLYFVVAAGMYLAILPANSATF